jgi:hypothetical protein
MRARPPRWILIASASALVGAGAVAAAWAITSGGPAAPSKRGKVDISFEPGLPNAARPLEGQGGLARVVQTVNHEVRLPTDIHVRVVGAATAKRVKAAGPMYEPSSHTVYFPWSFFDESRDDLGHLKLLRNLRPAQLDEVAKGAMLFVLYHELAHGLIDVLDIPVVASEEQMADSFAAVLAIVSGRGGESLPLSAAALQEARSERQAAPTLFDYADDHGFDRQRAFNDICLVYGSAPKRYSSLVQAGFLPAGRVGACPFEYKRTVRSWARLLAPWLTQAKGLTPLGR